MINPNDYVKTINSEYKRYGVDRDEIMFVAALKPVPVDENDLYLQRVYIACCPGIYDDNGLLTGFDYTNLMLCDARNLEKVEDEFAVRRFNEVVKANLEAKFSQEGVTSEENFH